MKKTIVTSIFGLICCSTGYAGSVGPIASQESSRTTPYLSLEGSYTWAQLTGYSVNSNSPGSSSQPWGGRFAAGFLYSIAEPLRLSAEFGGGYYGSKTGNNQAGGYDARGTIDGYDLLVGFLYKVSQFDVFGSVGVMSQNNRAKLTQYFAQEIPGGLYSGVLTTKLNSTQSLPEVKAGGIYNLNDNWAISLAYLHVFGSDLKATYTISATRTPASIVQNGFIDKQNPSLNSIMLGIRYNIV